MLDEKDLQAIAALINDRAAQTEELIETRAVQTEKLIETRAVQTEELIETRAVQIESMLINEMERYDDKNTKRFNEFTKDLEELKTIYRLTKTENETINMLLRIIENLEKRVSELEKKTA